MEDARAEPSSQDRRTIVMPEDEEKTRKKESAGRVARGTTMVAHGLHWQMLIAFLALIA